MKKKYTVSSTIHSLKDLKHLTLYRELRCSILNIREFR